MVNESGLGVRDAVVRYEVTAGDTPTEQTPSRKQAFSWTTPRRSRRVEGLVTAVDGVSLDVRPGEVVALLGASGSGKSSLLRAIAGLEPLASGMISWNGHDLGRTPTHKRNFGMMFQQPALFPTMDVGRNVAYGLDGLPRRERAGVVERMLELVGLPGYASRQVHELSGGQAQRVALARSLAPEPRLLLLDEPLSALDRGLREHLVDVLGAVLRETGTTAVHVTHDQDEAFALADRVALLADGKLLQFGTTDELWHRPATVEVAAFLGFDTFLNATDVAAFALEDVAGDHLVALGPESLRVDDGGLKLRVLEQKVRRGYVQVSIALPSGEKAELRVPEKLGTGLVGVVTDARSVALVAR